ncbi:MAG: Rho termination factor N-terminal domain-containing protein [Actinomycetota bacterium]|nr:Rho termination factor N-terminal domain-containing protein [Actinomycetota bacterium]
MIEKIARRAGGFTSTTALRWLNAARGAAAPVVPDLPGPSRRSSSIGSKLGVPIRYAGALGAVAVVARNRKVREELAQGLRSLTDVLRPDEAVGSASSARGNSNGSRGQHRSNGTAGQHRSNGSATSGTHGNGSGALSKKTRAELYEMAKSRNVEGRSKMSKEQLARALSR